METLFVPYHLGKPSWLEINGHKVLILSPDKDAFARNPDPLSIDYLEPLYDVDSVDDLDDALGHLEIEVGSSVVVAPPAVPLCEVIANLTHELPWVH